MTWIVRSHGIAAIIALLLAGCGGSTPSLPVPPAPVFTPFPVLVPGSKFTYAGRFSESITYASPSSQQPNSLGDYKTFDVVKISTAPPTAPAPVEVSQDLRYTVISVPTSGIQPQHRVISSLESSVIAHATQTISQAEGITTTTGIDQTANRTEGNGPYNYQSTVTTAYSTPRALLVLPLVAGATSVPLARTVETVEHSANAGGKVYSSRDTTAHYSNAGAYVETGSIGPGETTKVNTLANGTASLVNAGTSELREKIGLPKLGASDAYVIPVTRIIESLKERHLAQDWYPGAAAPPSPLAAMTQTVKGAATIPSNCNVKAAVRNVQEVDTSSTTLGVVTGNYTVEKARDFLSDGNTACRIITSTILTYSVTSGRLFSTRVDSFSEGLTAASIP